MSLPSPHTTRMTFALWFNRQSLAIVVHTIKHFSPYSVLAAVGVGVGFVREMVVASHYGLTPDLDVYVAVMGFHLFFGVQIGNAHEMVLVSRCSSASTSEQPAAYIGVALSGLFMANAFIALLIVATYRSIVPWVFPGFAGSQINLAVSFMYCFLMTIAMSNIGGVLRGILSANKIFPPGFLSGPIVSLTSIISVIILSDRWGIWALMIGFTLGNIGVLTMLAASVGRVVPWKAILRRMSWSRAVLTLWISIGTVLLGELFFQGITISERSFASTLAPGTIAAFSYAAALVAVPGALIGGPLTTLLYPNLAHAIQVDRPSGVRMVLINGMALFGLGVILAAVICVFADPIVTMIFMRGKFTLEDVHRTGTILSILALALPVIGPSRLLTYTFYSLADYRAPMLRNLLNWAALILFAIVLVPRYGVLGLAVSSVAALVGAELLTLGALVRRLRTS